MKGTKSALGLHKQHPAVVPARSARSPSIASYALAKATLPILKTVDGSLPVATTPKMAPPSPNTNSAVHLGCFSMRRICFATGPGLYLNALGQPGPTPVQATQISSN